MKIAICDDEPIYIETTSRLLQKWAGEHGIEMQIFTYDNGDDLIAAHTDECMDLILLDVIMPLLNGIDTAAELRANGQDVPIIFLTSSREFAVESYEVKAFHYLLKPIDEIRLPETILQDQRNLYGTDCDRFLQNDDRRGCLSGSAKQTGTCNLFKRDADHNP